MLLLMMLLLMLLLPLPVKTSEPPTPWLTVKLLIWPPSSVKTLLTVIVLALLAWLPENVPPCRLNAPLLKNELTVVLWPRVIAAPALLLTASSPAPGVEPLSQLEGDPNQSPEPLIQLTGPACAAETLSRDRKPSPRPAARRRERRLEECGFSEFLTTREENKASGMVGSSYLSAKLSVGTTGHALILHTLR